MTHDRSERELREMLAGRAPTAASASMRARLQTVTSTTPGRTAGWLARLKGPARVGLGVAATAVSVIVLVGVLANVDRFTISDPGRVGASPMPGVAAVPFVIAPAGVFTEAAERDAGRRLEAVYAATGLEATFVVQAEPTGAHLSAPDGWPDRFDRDGDPDRDVTAVFGIGPDGAVLCCLTLAGDLILEAQAASYWQPLDMPGALDDDLAASTPEFRDVALERFVGAIERLAPNLATLRAETLNRGDLRGAVAIAMVVGPVLLLAAVGLRRRRIVATSGPGSGGTELVELPLASAMPAPTRPQAGADADPVVEWPTPATVRIVPQWPDRGLIGIVLAVVFGFAVLSVVDLVLPPATSVRLDPSLERSGIARIGPNIVPLGLLAIGLGALVAFARQGRWRRRLGAVALVVSVGWPMSVVVSDARPTLPDQDRGWLASEGAITQRGGMGLIEHVTFRLTEGATFTFATTIRNPSAVPITILGLDGVRTTQPNPYVASVTGLGWVVQPGRADAVTTLSARPEDASATWPVTIPPGGSLAIVLVGRAGPCADAGGSVRDLPLTHVDLAYRVLGFERTTEVGLPATLAFAGRSPCTVETPGGTVTYRAPAP